MGKRSQRLGNSRILSCSLLLHRICVRLYNPSRFPVSILSNTTDFALYSCSVNRPPHSRQSYLQRNYNETTAKLQRNKTCLKRNLNQKTLLASYPAFPRVRFYRLQYEKASIFHTVSDKNLTRGKAGYEAKTLQRFKDLPNQNKLIVSEVKSVDLARDPFEYFSQNLVGKDVMFANADIYLGGGFDRVDALLMSRQKIMYPLTRRVAQEERCNGNGDGVHMVDLCLDSPYIGSHDVLLFRLIEPLPEQFFMEMEFGLVSPGMENIVIWLFQNMLKYCTLNPCTILETFHFHCSNLRSDKGHRVNTAGKSGLSGFTKNLVCST